MTMSAAILCAAVCISDVINKTVTVSESNTTLSNLYLLFFVKAWTNMAAPWEAQIQNEKGQSTQKVTYPFYYVSNF